MPTLRTGILAPMRFNAWVIAGVTLFIGFGTGLCAEKKPSGDPAVVQQQAQQKVAMPDAEKIVLLLRNTLITLNDAIQTGNFTVFRDRAAPGFREANSAARLSQAFSDLASKGVDLSAVSVIVPQLTAAPTLDSQKGMLQLKGYFPGKPVQINFEVIFQAVAGRWQLLALSVQPSQTGAPGAGKN
jgi:hypothetical protein